MREMPPAAQRALEAFDVGVVRSVNAGGGTASPKFIVEADRGKYLLRARSSDFAAAALVQFDHEVLRRLSEAGMPVPVPLRQRDGRTWMEVDGTTYEMPSWVDGDPFVWEDEKSLESLGTFLGRFHRVLGRDVPDGKQGWRREDHPDLVQPYCDPLLRLAHSTPETELLKRIEAQIEFVRRELDSGLYERLPKFVIHGDIHPGNVRFRNSQVAALYDFDYLSLQARVRDVVDGLMFFAARRETPMRTDDIRSLTQPMQPDLQRSAVLLRGYQSVAELTELEWKAIPLLMRSRWIQIRLRGSRKVPNDEKMKFVLDRFFKLIVWLDDQAEAFFSSVRDKLSPSKAARPRTRSSRAANP